MTLRHVTKAYDLGGLVVQDVSAWCGRCDKRLCEVIHDPTRKWPTSAIVCLDCGTRARVA